MKQHLHEQHIALCHPLWLHARHGWIVSIWGLSLAQTGTISPFSAWPVATLPELGSTSGFWYTQLVVAPAIACSGSWAASAMKKRLAHGKKTWLLTTWIHDVSGPTASPAVAHPSNRISETSPVTKLEWRSGNGSPQNDLKLKWHLVVTSSA